MFLDHSNNWPMPTGAEGWQTDERGRKYRNLGRGCIEYAPTISINGIEVEYSPEALAAMNDAQHKAQEQARREAEQEQQKHTGKICPLYTASPAARECMRDCALYAGGACVLASKPAAVDTRGKRCPFNSVCGPSCALYAGGCALHGFAALAAGKELQNGSEQHY